jgi:hypothetical protein
VQLVRDRQGCLSDGDVEELNMADVVRSMPSAEEGVSLGSGGCNGTSRSGRI